MNGVIQRDAAGDDKGRQPSADEEPGIELDPIGEAVEVSAPSALRMPISLVRRSVVKAASPNRTVEDNGPGLPSDAADRIFVPFFTTKPHGSGIGLSIVRQIMVAHGGRVEPVPCGVGATFRLTF